MTHSTDQFVSVGGPAKGFSPAPATTSPEQQGNALLEHQRALVAMGRRAIAPPDLPILMQDAADLLAGVLDTQYGLVAELAA
jgi:2,4-dienoyl-CoA reductase-like NADH-dependent reductase (Old Yellow Enzyme family)